MTKLLADCKRLFRSSNLYEVLAIQKSASASEVKKAYYRRSLIVHPDRVDKNERKEATEKFQVLGRVYSILSDQEQRKIYDETGSVSDDTFVVEDRDWTDYWRILFPKVTLKDIQDFEAKYKGSDEELSDLKSAYLHSHGDVDLIMDSVLCSTHDDEQRYRDLLEPLVTSGELPSYDLFINEPEKKRLARKRKAERERKEAEAELKKTSKKSGSKGGSEGGDAAASSLTDLILANNQSREQQADDFFKQLEQKYGNTATGKNSTSKNKSESKSKKKTTRSTKKSK